MSDLSMHSHASSELKQNYLAHAWLGSGLFWSVILVLIIFMLLVFFKPDYVLRKKDCEVTDEVDCMKALLVAIVIALVINFVLALLYYAMLC